MKELLIGIMQGRLVPPENDAIQAFPRQRWQDEFALASQVGLDEIEWIYDSYSAEANPLCSDERIGEIKQLSELHGVAVNSICADYFMENPWIRSSPAAKQERLEHLAWLMQRAEMLGVKYVLLPFVDSSRLESRAEVEEIAEDLNSILAATESATTEIHLETSLQPGEFAFLLSLLPSRRIKANYDSGNSASLGFQTIEEFAAYGNRVGSVHIKDRTLNGGTVPLGEGDAQLPTMFRELEHYGYEGSLILQVARDKPGDEVSWARFNRQFVLDCFHQTLKEVAT